MADILVNTRRQVYIERFGKLGAHPTKFDNDEHVMRIIDRIVSRIGRRVDESSPRWTRLADGSRVNAIIPGRFDRRPGAFSIRRFGVRTLNMPDPARAGKPEPGDGGAPPGSIVKARLNTRSSAATGSGKMTLLNAMSSHIPVTERVVTIEDAAELQLLQPHVVRLETRPANIEGPRRDLAARAREEGARRMRPDRIVVGEVRGAEVMDMLQAMNTGHDGSLTTIHNSSRDALHRLETLHADERRQPLNRVMRRNRSAALGVVVHATRLSDGTRRVMAVQRNRRRSRTWWPCRGHPVFRKDRYRRDGKILGHFEATGIRPKFADQLKLAGVNITPAVFREGQVI